MARLLRQDRISTSVTLVLGLLLAQKIVGFARGIVFARILGSSEYGIYTLGFFLILIVVAITGLGIPSSFGRYAPRYQSRKALTWFFRKAYVLNICLSIGVAAVMLLVPSSFSRLIYGDASHTRVMVVAGLSVPALVVLTNLVHTFAGLKLFRASSLSQFSQVAIFAILGTIFALLYRSAASALLANALSIAITLVLFLPLLRRHLMREEPEPAIAQETGFYRRLLAFTVWFTLTPILIHVFHYVDRLSLQRMLSSSQQGIYSAAVNLSETISAVGLAVNNVIFPHLSTAWEQGRKAGALANLDAATRLTTIALTVIGLALVLLGKPLILLLLGEEYGPGAQVLPYLVIFHLFMISVWLFGVYASLIEKTYVSTAGLACAVPVNLLLNLVLIPRLGMLGAGLATMLSNLLLWAVVVRICAALGMHVSRRTIAVAFLPLLLLLPGLAAASAVAVVIVICLRTSWLVTEKERHRALEEFASFVGGVRSRQ